VNSLRRPGKSGHTANDDERDDQLLASMPLPIRWLARASRAMQPFHELARAAVLFLLVAVGSMSAMLMLGDKLRSVDVPADEATSSFDVDVSSPDVAPAFDTAVKPDADATEGVPTAVGPSASPSWPVMAVASTEQQPTSPYPVTPYPEAVLPQVVEGTLPQVQTDDPAIARRTGQTDQITPR
jgi:hypothetical protein